MARAPRADVKLLKSLRNLSSGYGPSAADTLGDGKHLLERASKLKSFVKDQKKKTKASSAKTEWLLDLKRLEDEWQEQACSYRQLLEDTATKDAGVLDVCKEASEQFQACDEELAGCGPALRGEVREMAEQVKAICCYGVEDPDLLEETRYVQQRLQHLTRKLSSQLQAMAGEAVHLSLVVRNAWPLFVDEDKPEEMEGEEAEAGGGSQLQVVGLLEPQLRGLVVLEMPLAVSQLPSVSGIQDVELLVSRHPGAPQHLKEELMQTSRALCCQYHSRLLHLQPGNCQDPSRPAGWSVDEHAVFRKSRALLFQQLPGKARQETRLQLLQRIADRLPGRCADEVAQYEDWYRRHQAIWQRRREVRLGWLRVMGQLLQEGERLLQDAAAAVLDQAALAADGVECEVQRVQLHGRLQVMREVKLEEDEKLAVDAARKAQEDAAKTALAAAAEQRRQARNKERVVVFREARRAELEAARAAELQQEAAAAASRQQQVVEQRSRVQLRQQELQQKQQLLQDKKAQLAQAEQARERRLESIRALVRVHAESDPGRLLQPTETSTALPQASQPAFRSVHGYTTQQLLSDQRFRLLEKLSSNGLHDSSQARAALAAARPFRPPRLDQFTSDQLAPY